MATCTDCGFVHDVVCQPGHCGFDLVASDHALRAENERLRGALGEIVDLAARRCVADIARAALTGSETCPDTGPGEGESND